MNKRNPSVKINVCFIFMSSLLFLGASTVASGEEHVVTLYFAGTGINEDFWRADKTDWKNGAELLATLYHEQIVNSATQHAAFIAGIGALPPEGHGPEGYCNLLNQLLQKGLPGSPICRWWETLMADARDALEEVLIIPDSTVILNLVGYSRGGIAAMMFARRVESIDADDQVTRIHILAVEPVSGVRDLPADAFIFGDKVAKFVGIYAHDERSLLFWATVPDWDPEMTDGLMLKVRGSHETVAGNRQRDGHSVNLGVPNFLGWWDVVPELVSVSRLAGGIALELLGSPQWGDVEFLPAIYDTFYPEGTSEFERESQFLGYISDMNDSGIDYEKMRKFYFVPLGGESYRHEFLFGTTCWWFDPFMGPLLGTHNAPRCVWRYRRPAQQYWSGLDYHVDIPLLGVGVSGSRVWGKIWLFGTTDLDPDDDGDGILDGDDNCPLVYNPDQLDVDGDGFGDSCDDDNDNDGVPDEIDNCPLDQNPFQEDNEEDGAGDACDDDDDNDGVPDVDDNCPLASNADQLDFDSDGFGDACDGDVDGDGVDNESDVCEFTEPGAVVDPANGCSVNQLCPCEGPAEESDGWRNHGKYVSCVSRAAESFVDMGLITEDEKDAMVSDAAGSSCGKKK